MVKHENFRPGPGIDIFNIAFDQIFEYSHQTDKWTYHPEKMQKGHLSFLLAWPGFLSFEFAETTGDEALAKKVRKFQKLLSETTEKDQISDLEKQVTDLIQEVFSRVFFSSTSWFSSHRFKPNSITNIPNCTIYNTLLHPYQCFRKWQIIRQ